MLNILFMGTPDFAKESLESIYNAGHNIIGVVTNQDKPKGRGMKMTYSPVKEFALSKEIKIFQPIKVRKNEEFIEEIKKIKPDLICVVAYGKILPKEILEIPKYGCINVHGSLLPKYRGAAPIQWAVLNGDKTTGITTMFMDEGMDTGDILLKEEIEIFENETTGELWERLSKIGGKLLVETIKKLEDGSLTKIKQPEEFTLAPMLTKEMAKINWEEFGAQKIKNLVRGLNPIIGAYSIYEDKKIKFWNVNVIANKDITKFDKELENYKERLNKLEPGTIIISDEKIGLLIKAKDAIISVNEIQGENAKKMNIKDYLRGNRLEIGVVLK